MDELSKQWSLGSPQLIGHLGALSIRLRRTAPPAPASGRVALDEVLTRQVG